jgi:hypothetical protein
MADRAWRVADFAFAAIHTLDSRSMPLEIDRVIAELEAVVEDSLAAQSRRGYFAALYLRVTREIRARIVAGYFDDAARMDRLDAVFARRYLDALAAHRAQRPLAQSWLIAFEATARVRPLILQHLLLGMNAHINLDLGIAAAEVAEGSDLRALHADFMKVNEVLSDLSEQVQDSVARSAPLARVLDLLAGHSDEMLVRFSMERARDGAWELAEQLAALPASRRAEAIESRDVRIAVLAEGLARPGLIASVLALVPRLLERGNPADVTRALLGGTAPAAAEHSGDLRRGSV